ncbi:hypothetical protein Anae109_4234 [Anaeromyxobacter sp. Fw109-5]|nr:hypothetical protein Anae109_4234 [Anaeromyxobacter sp. Fw109-5]
MQLDEPHVREPSRRGRRDEGPVLVEPEPVPGDAAELAELRRAREAQGEEAARPQHAVQLAERPGEVGPEVDRVGGRHDVEARVLERERLDDPDLEPRLLRSAESIASRAKPRDRRLGRIDAGEAPDAAAVRQLEQGPAAEADVEEPATRRELHALQRRLDEVAVPAVQRSGHDGATEPATWPGQLPGDDGGHGIQQPVQKSFAHLPSLDRVQDAIASLARWASMSERATRAPGSGRVRSPRGGPLCGPSRAKRARSVSAPVRATWRRDLAPQLTAINRAALRMAQPERIMTRSSGRRSIPG